MGKLLKYKAQTMNLRKICNTVLVAIFILVFTSYTLAQETIQDNTVRINVGTSWGSGAYVGDRLVLSCAHLYKDENTTQTQIWFPDGKAYVGKPLKIDTVWDQSLIELNTRPKNLGIPMASTNPQPGDAVYAYGYGRGNKIIKIAGNVQKYLGNSQDTSVKDWFALTGSAESGSSGGPIVNADGYIIGDLWGTDGVRTVGLCTGRTRLFLLPWRNRLAQGQCRNGTCYPPSNGAQQPTIPSPGLEPLPPQFNIRPPIVNDPTSPPCNCNPNSQVDPQKVADILKKDPDFIAKTKGEPGKDGVNGKDGAPGKNGTNGKDAELTTEHIAAMTAAILQQLKSDKEFLDASKGDKGDKGDQGVQGEKGDKGDSGDTQQIPDSKTGWSHLVLIASSNSEYWYRLKYEYEKATDYYNQIRHVEPPTDRNIGPMPLLVAYSGGIPAKSWVGLRDVSQALNYITRGEYDKFLLGTSDEN